jgi:hypothetical protein
VPKVIEGETGVGLFDVIVVLEEGDHDGVDQRIEGENGEQNDRRGQIKPRLPIVLFAASADTALWARKTF